MESLNELTELAAKYVNTTDRHIFLTGKAGTGKTTFLKYIIRHTYKNAVIAAPTGIAAINAGGVTLHSLLQLPFGTFIPENIQFTSMGVPFNTPRTLFRNARFNASKRRLIRELELLIIDEVSMLRADLLDCVDHTLRFLRRRREEPFGGLQILFIGDLLQLPPVVREDEKALLNQYYRGNYFFEARALQENPPIRVELREIYRQKDQRFIELLNRLRHNELTHDDITHLNKYYRSDLEGSSLSGYIHLTTHNNKAHRINQNRLQNLEGKEKTYHARVDSQFPDHLYPTDGTLTLKEGAQVMFIKNDPTGQQRFFNGKVAAVSKLGQDSIRVRFEDGKEIEVEPYKWEHKRYVLNKTTSEIEEKFLGCFEQYPLKLAWAVTIHKSQGLTFDKAILDLSDTFAPGQLYVALSRLTSLDGLVLSSSLPENPPGIDDSLNRFVSSFQSSDELEQNLRNDRRTFLINFAKRAFGFGPLLRELSFHEKSFNKDERRSLKQRFHEWTKKLVQDTAVLKKTGDTFIKQVERIVQEDNNAFLAERLQKAHDHFKPLLSNQAEKIEAHKNQLKREAKTKTYRKELENLKNFFEYQERQIRKLTLLVNRAAQNKVLTREELTDHEQVRQKKKQKKTPTAEISYNLYKQGKSIEQIATQRGLVPGTIEGHLSKYIARGELDVSEFISSEKLGRIMKKYEKGLKGLGEIKSGLGHSVSYGEIKMGLAHAEWVENSIKENS